jgi:regulatory protein
VTLGWSAASPDAHGGEALHPAQDPADRLQHALGAAYRFLARRDRTVWEVRRHLEGQGVQADAIDGAIEELRHQGYLDDARYAQTFAQDRRALDAWGPDRIARKLSQVGIAAELVEAATGDRGPQEELEAAVDLLRRKLRVAPQDDRGRERALGLLARRGYDLELAYAAVRAFQRDPDGDA